MEQRTEKEEAEYKVVPDNISLCVRCGVAVNPATNNLCPKCFNATAAASTSTSAGGAEPTIHVFVDKSFRSRSSLGSSSERRFIPAGTSRDLKKEASIAGEGLAAPPTRREVNRCSGCRRMVGLTGFRCRCGELFCADHRYSDRHDCSYDYKSSGREAIARENPVVKAPKIVKF